MKKTTFIHKLAGVAVLLFTLFACDPQMDDAIDIGAAPTADQLDFTITQGSTAFKFVMTNTSSIAGIPTWDLGNGSKSTASAPTATYSLPGTYTVTLTLVTKGGTASISKTVTQTETDYTIFTDEKFIYLSGGAEDLDGKTWVLDSLSTGHLGVGAAGGNGLEWWAAAPLAKQAVGVLYDDEINFNITGFAAVLTNHGSSYVKDYRKNDSSYANPREKDTDYIVDYNPSPGTWFIEEKDGANYLTLNGPTPMFPCFDVGAVDGYYKILSLSENLLELVATGSDGNAWHYQLIPKGYVKPSVTADLSVVAASEVNTYDVSLTNVSIPTGASITKVSFAFGDGDPVESTDYTAVASHTYMRAGTYTITVTATTSVGTMTWTQSVTCASNHPDYVPFLLNEMIIYNDFSEVALQPVQAQDCSVMVVDNPERIYPNRSAYVAHYTKTNNQWANAYLQLPAGYRFDLRTISTFKILVYGKAGDKVLLKLENTDRGGNAWQTGTADLIYTIQADNTWEVAEYNFAGVSAGWDWTGDIYTSNVATDNNFSHDFYNVVRIMLNPGNGDGTHEFYFDDLSGPHVEGIKSATIK